MIGDRWGVPAPFVAALSPLAAAGVMVAHIPWLDPPLLGLVAGGLLALSAVPLLVAAAWGQASRGGDALRSLIVLTVLAVIEVAHFTVRVSGWLRGEPAVLHPATIAPSLVVLAALVWMWRRTPVQRLLATPRG